MCPYGELANGCLFDAGLSQKGLMDLFQPSYLTYPSPREAQRGDLNPLFNLHRIACEPGYTTLGMQPMGIEPIFTATLTTVS